MSYFVFHCEGSCNDGSCLYGFEKFETEEEAKQFVTKVMKDGGCDEPYCHIVKGDFAHVTGMIGINQTYEEKKNGIQRLNWIVRREDEPYCHIVKGDSVGEFRWKDFPKPWLESK